MFKTMIMALSVGNALATSDNYPTIGASEIKMSTYESGQKNNYSDGGFDKVTEILLDDKIEEMIKDGFDLKINFILEEQVKPVKGVIKTNKFAIKNLILNSSKKITESEIFKYKLDNNIPEIKMGIRLSIPTSNKLNIHIERKNFPNQYELDNVVVSYRSLHFKNISIQAIPKCIDLYSSNIIIERNVHFDENGLTDWGKSIRNYLAEKFPADEVDNFISLYSIDRKEFFKFIRMINSNKKVPEFVLKFGKTDLLLKKKYKNNFGEKILTFKIKYSYDIRNYFTNSEIKSEKDIIDIFEKKKWLKEVFEYKVDDNKIKVIAKNLDEQIHKIPLYFTIEDSQINLVTQIADIDSNKTNVENNLGKEKEIENSRQTNSIQNNKSFLYVIIGLLASLIILITAVFIFLIYKKRKLK
ncbi:hypothetical protein [Mesoplasma photuris]|uniref:hypothetical protein n=1 Tax=Mesoplasma photuris TaxID=217731 RepID=UPI0004E265B1|nr:hypothetical protein [Mesoplasma photuris]